MRLNLNKSLTYIQEQVSRDSLTNSCSGEGCQVYLTEPPHKGRYKISKGVGNQHEIKNVNNAIVVYIFFTFPYVSEPYSNQD